MTKPLPRTRLSAAEVNVVHYLHAKNKSVAHIAHELRRSVSAVRHWLRLPPDALEPGKPKIARRVAERQKRKATLKRIVGARVCHQGKARPKFCSLSAIRAELIKRSPTTTPVSRMTICRDLRELQYGNRVRPKVCTTDPSDFAKRLAFCRAHSRPARKGYVDAKRIVFSDEKILHLQ